MKRLIALCIIGVAVSAWAAISIQEQPGPHELRERDGRVIARYDSHEACIAAAQLAFASRSVSSEQYKCVNTVAITVTGDCSDVPKPAPVVDAAGFTLSGNLEGHQCADDPNRWYFTETRIMPTSYPQCWAQQAVPISDCSIPPPECPPGKCWAPSPDQLKERDL